MDDQILTFLRGEVRRQVSDWRYAHILSVEQEAANLAQIYMPEKTDKIRIAAILHDITKDFNVEKQLNLCEKFGIIQNDSYLYGKILHSFTGAEWIKREYPSLVDEEIVSAVRWHTVGRENMTPFECLIYLADFIEPTRPFEECKALRAYFYSQLELPDANKWTVLIRTMIRSLDESIRSLVEEGCMIAPSSVSARNYFLKLSKNNADCFI